MVSELSCQIYTSMAQLISASNGNLITVNTNQLQWLTPSNFPSWSATLKSPLQTNLISMHCFTKVNNVLIKFQPDYFLVKDWFTETTLLQGRCEDEVYSLSTLFTLHKISTNPSQRASQNLWHCRIGHPSKRIISQITKSFHLFVTSFSLNHVYNSCHINKSQ